MRGMKILRIAAPMLRLFLKYRGLGTGKSSPCAGSLQRLILHEFEFLHMTAIVREIGPLDLLANGRVWHSLPHQLAQYRLQDSAVFEVIELHRSIDSNVRLKRLYRAR